MRDSLLCISALEGLWSVGPHDVSQALRGSRRTGRSARGQKPLLVLLG